MHIWSLQPFSQDYGLASQTTHVVCVNLISEWQHLQFKVVSDFLRNFCKAGLFTLRIFAKNLLRGNRRRNILFFSYFIKVTYTTEVSKSRSPD